MNNPDILKGHIKENEFMFLHFQHSLSTFAYKRYFYNKSFREKL